jgi:hypothetical protein
MKYIKLFEEYISEAESVDPKIQFLRLKKIEGSTDNETMNKLTRQIAKRCFDEYVLKDYEGKVEELEGLVDTSRPIIYYGTKRGWSADFIEGLSSKNRDSIYNLPEEQFKTGSKVNFHKLFGDADFIPKTVFTVKDAQDLKYPVIAKPSEGMSGVGIEKFDSYEDLKDSDGEFDLYSECIDFEREFRAMCLKDDLIMVYERVPIIADGKTVGTKKRDEEVSFLYVDQDLKKLPIIDKVKDLVKNFRKCISLDLYSMDFFLDKEGKLWIIEGNASSGLGSNSLAGTYPAIHRDFYSKGPSNEMQKFLQGVRESYWKATKEDYPEEYKKSLSPY